MLILAMGFIVVFEGRAQLLDKPILEMSYFSHLGTHPGLAFGASQTLSEFGRNRKWKPITISYRVPLTAKMGFYYHKNYHTAGLIMLNTGIERSNEKLRSWALLPGIGYTRSFIPNTYKITDTGIEEITVSHGAFTAQIGLRHSRPLGKNNLAYKWYVQPTYLRAYKNNGTYTAHFLFELGITKNLTS